MKILLFSHSSQLEGAERSLLSIISTLIKHDVLVRVVTPNDGPLVPALRRLGVINVKFIRNPLWIGNPGSIMRQAILLIAMPLSVLRCMIYIWREDPAVVLVNSIVRPSGLFAAWLLRRKVVVYVRESVFTNPTLNSLLPKRVIVYLVATTSTRIFYVSEYVRGQVGLPGVVLPPDVRDVSLRGALKKKCSDGLHILMMGKVSEEKGQSDLLHALDELRRSGVKFQARIYGSANSDYGRSFVERLSEMRASDVEWIPPVADVGPALEWADCSVVLSGNEAYGRVTAESLLASVPVVGYRLGGTVEILARGGGLLIEPSVLALADALQQLATDDALRTELVRQCLDLDPCAAPFGNSEDVYSAITELKQSSFVSPASDCN